MREKNKVKHWAPDNLDEQRTFGKGQQLIIFVFLFYITMLFVVVYGNDFRETSK